MEAPVIRLAAWLTGWEEIRSDLAQSSITGALAARHTVPTSKSEWKKSCGDDLLQQTTNKDGRQTKGGIDCALIYMASPGISPAASLW